MTFVHVTRGTSARGRLKLAIYYALRVFDGAVFFASLSLLNADASAMWITSDWLED